MNWPLVKLGELCDVVRGSSPRPQGDPRYYGGIIPRLMVSDVTRDGKLVTPKIDFLTEEGAKKSRPMKSGDFVIAVSGQPGQPLILAVDACIHDGFAGLRHLQEEKINKDYLYRFMIFVKDKFSATAVGAIFKNLTTEQIRDLDIPLPPLPEQRRIAAILDQADVLRAKRREALAQLDSLTQSIFIEMFGGGNQYPMSSLEYMCELITDGTHQTPTYSDTGTIFLSAKNVTSGYIDWKNIKYIPEGLHKELHRRLAPKMNDILLAKNGTTGVAAIVDRECVFDIYVSLALLRAKNDFVPQYILGAINSPICKKQFNDSLKGIGVPNLHLKEIRATKIPMPPIDLQRNYAARIAAIEKQKICYQKSLAEFNALFSSIQHRAFRGEL